MAAGKLSKTFIWVILALLIVGLAGFGAVNFSGSVRSIGKVGDTEIPVTTYVRGLQNELRAFEAETGQPVTFAQARTIGLDQVALGKAVTAASLDNETARMGISLGDELLRDQVLDIPAFQGLDGSFDREAYAFALSRSGMTEAQFEEELRKEAARTLLQGAVAAGAAAPAPLLDAVTGYLGERRDFTWARLGSSDLETPTGTPTDAELQAFHEANPDLFTLPEMKRITFAWLTPAMLLDRIELDDATLRQAYQERSAEFQRPESRLVERLVYSDAASAQAAADAIAAGELTFEEAVAGRGLELVDVDLGDVTPEDLSQAAADAVFALDGPGVAGPAETSLGPALFRVNAILPAQTTSFEDARGILRDELAMDQAVRQIANEAETIENELAAGATLEELADTTAMELGTIDWFYDAGGAIADYSAFRDYAATLTTEDFPETVELEDGGIFAARMEETLPPRVQPLDEIRAEAVDVWQTRRTMERLRARGQEILGQVANGGSFVNAGLDPVSETGITRRDFVPGTPEGFLDRIFELAPGGTALIDNFGSVILVQLDQIQGPDPEDPDLETARETLRAQASAGIAQDLLTAYTRHVQAEAGISLDQQALNAVHSSFQ